MVGRAAFQEVSGTPDQGKEETEELRRYLGEGIASLQGRQVEGRGMVAFRSGYLCQVEERACLGRHQEELGKSQMIVRVKTHLSGCAYMAKEYGYV